MNVPPLQPGQCAVCRFAEAGIGYHPPGHHRPFTAADVTWTCRQDIDLAPTVHHMTADDLTLTERRALDAAGEAGGAFLDVIGKSDLATLTADEFRDFLAHVLEGWGVSMRDQLRANAAPF